MINLDTINLSIDRMLYFADILNTLYDEYDGNIIEIGGGYGENTTTFLGISKLHSRKVLVIDPYESGWDNMPEGYKYKYDIFNNATRNYDNMYLHRYSSLDESCHNKIIEFDPIIFAFIDGLQYKDVVISDLRLIERFNPPIICVDDYNRLTDQSQVPLAVDEFVKDSKYKIIKTGGEVYLSNI